LEKDMTSPARLALVALAAWVLWASAVCAADTKVEAQLSITDEDSGLSVVVKRQVAVGTTGLDFMKATVAMEVKSYPGLGVRVLKLCDVAPARGKYWALFVDGKYSESGIAEVTMEKDTRIEWKTQK
jgi:hypothetical protein